MTLALRRFPESITRRRQASGTRNRAGEWVPGAVEETELRASVQPLKLEDVDMEDGSRLSEMLKVYTPAHESLLAAADYCLPENDPERSLAIDDLVRRGIVTVQDGADLKDGEETQLAFGADQIVWLGQVFTVLESRSWPGGHTRATIIRAT